MLKTIIKVMQIYERQQSNISNDSQFFSPCVSPLGRKRCSKVAHVHPEHQHFLFISVRKMKNCKQDLIVCPNTFVNHSQPELNYDNISINAVQCPVSSVKCIGTNWSCTKHFNDERMLLHPDGNSEETNHCRRPARWNNKVLRSTSETLMKVVVMCRVQWSYAVQPGSLRWRTFTEGGWYNKIYTEMHKWDRKLVQVQTS